MVCDGLQASYALIVKVRVVCRKSALPVWREARCRFKPAITVILRICRGEGAEFLFILPII